MTVNCPYCGSEVRENEKFCQSCGAAMDPNRAPAQQSAVQTAANAAHRRFFPFRPIHSPSVSAHAPRRLFPAALRDLSTPAPTAPVASPQAVPISSR